MATNHDVWDAIVQTAGTPANSFEMLVDVWSGGSFKRTADVTNVAPAFTDKSRARQTYAAKGVDKAIKYGSNLVLTFDMEAVRDANGAFQPELQTLLNAGKVNGLSNIIRLRVYDALGADYAFDADFQINVTRTNTGWDDAGFWTVTATQYNFRGWITNPVLVGLVPVINNVTPVAAAVGTTIYIMGDNFTGTVGATGVKIGVTNATSYIVQNDELITAVMPAGSASVTFVTVTSPVGASDPYTYQRGA